MHLAVKQSHAIAATLFGAIHAGIRTIHQLRLLCAVIGVNGKATACGDGDTMCLQLKGTTEGLTYFLRDTDGILGHVDDGQ